jgi:hypothetical protein
MVFLMFWHQRMNFPINNLENYLNETWLLSGEALLEDGAVSDLIELERHLWVVRVGNAEVEIQISPSRVKAYSCDCSQFKAEKGCGHIAAALMALRNRLAEKQESRPKPKPVSKPKKMTVPGLLRHISSDELADFVRDYAAQNRAFALALKARFTSALPMEEKREKYLELLDSAIRDVRGTNDRVGRRGAQQLAGFALSLLDQAREAVAENHPRDAAILLTSILEKIGPVSQKTDEKNGKLNEVMKDAFSLLKRVLPLSPAPELLHELWDFSLRESGKFHYRKTPLQTDFFRFLQQLAPALGKGAELSFFFKKQLLEMEAADPNRPELLILIYQLLAANGQASEAQEHLLEHINEPAFILYAVEEAIAGENLRKARFLAQKALEASPASPYTARLEELLFQLALRENDKESIVQFGAYRFLQSKDLSYIAHLKANSGQEWPQLANQLLEQLERLPYSILKRDAIASLLFEENRFDELAGYILRLQSLDLLQRYGPRWPQSLAQQTEELHLDILRAYLNNHLGKTPSQRVRQILENLLEADMREMAVRILTRFRADFPERTSLMEELETLPV